MEMYQLQWTTEPNKVTEVGHGEVEMRERKKKGKQRRHTSRHRAFPELAQRD
jgi:hypothetical protein